MKRSIAIIGFVLGFGIIAAIIGIGNAQERSITKSVTTITMLVPMTTVPVTTTVDATTTTVVTSWCRVTIAGGYLVERTPCAPGGGGTPVPVGTTSTDPCLNLGTTVNGTTDC